MNTPVLVVGFNRPETLAVLLRTLQEHGATNLYFALDGPRVGHATDGQRVAESRALIEKAFHPHPSRCLYQSSNLGIRKGPPAAITWFFEQVEEGIILEDDCIPSEDFFPFVQGALEKYRHVDQVKLISGFNRFSPQPWPESYRFVKTAMIWGWASWRRAWSKYDPDMKSWDHPLARREFRTWAGSFPVFDYWRTTIDWVRIGKIVTWDVAWCWTVFSDRGLGVMPRVSLIRNIGFGSDSTNTQSGDAREKVLPGRLPQPYIGPERLRPDRTLQRRLDRAEFWRTDDTVTGRLWNVARALKRNWFARQP